MTHTDRQRTSFSSITCTACVSPPPVTGRLGPPQCSTAASSTAQSVSQSPAPVTITSACPNHQYLHSSVRPTERRLLCCCALAPALTPHTSIYTPAPPHQHRPRFHSSAPTALQTPSTAPAWPLCSLRNAFTPTQPKLPPSTPLTGTELSRRLGQ